ncbi:MAG: GlsB/YeaQ/YmgE family stress response membrane protein [Phototrophicales bacterium]|nr:GlsB/YeaQ/YmgE family stress response membrane protein [Phototrophicales bacterium]
MGEMGWLAWIIVGGIAGWLASMVMKTNRSQGLIMDIVVGIIGAFIGGFLFSQINTTGVTGFNVWSIFVAFVGAVVLLGVLRLVNGRGMLPR